MTDVTGLSILFNHNQLYLYEFYIFEKTMDSEILLLILVAIVAFLYASVGHGGASGYLALMVIFGISPAIMKPSALMLNLAVSAIAFLNFYKSGYFRWKLLWPFVILSIPLAFLGARIQLETHVYKIILSICLLLAVLRIVGVFGNPHGETQILKLLPAIIIGGIIGFISGIIGVGGGIVLSPVLLLMRWADIKQTAAVSAAFIFLNSLSGIAGAASGPAAIPEGIVPMTVAAIAGGIAGSYFGSHRFNHVVLRYVLSVVLIIACTKLVIT